MMYRRLAAILVTAVLASCGGPGGMGSAEAAKPSVPAEAPRLESASIDIPPDPDTLAIIHESADGRRSPLLDPRGLPIYDDLGHGIRPEISIDRVNSMGYDIILDFRNDTTRRVGLGSITVGVITLGPDFEWLNLNRRSSFVEAARRSFPTQNRAYPGSFYAPVGVLHNDEFAVGVSLLYDILQDRHGVNIKINTPDGRYAGGPGGPGYSVGFDLGNPARGASRVEYPAELLPGEQRQYRVAVRAVKLSRPVTTSGEQEWLAAIEPYHEHFTDLYGGVTYHRDDRPVRGRSIASMNSVNRTNNPMGYNGGSRRRPDLVGWGPMIGQLMRPSGFDRSMLWNVGGLYTNNTALGFPSRFMSQLMSSTELNTAFSQQIGLPRLANTGHEMGLWWGRSSRVARQWDSPNWEPLDLNNPDRVALAMHEMQLAHATGATLIGLDAFSPRDMPVWQQYEWIIELRRRFPGTAFIIEPMSCDVLHTLAPTFAIAWQYGDRTGRPETRFRVHHAHHVADFLVPGHETWGFFRYDGSTLAENAQRVQRDAEYISSTGHVAVLSTSVPLQDASRARAEPTWLRTVPDRLKTSAHRSATPTVYSIPGVSEPPSDNRSGDGSGDNNSNGSSGDGSRNGSGEDDGKGDGNDRRNNDGNDNDPRMETTRPFMLPNGRVIRLPIYDRE